MKRYPRGDLSSKRRSGCESHYYRQQERLNSKGESESRDKNYRQYKTQNFESESKTKNENVKAIKVRTEEALTKFTFVVILSFRQNNNEGERSESHRKDTNRT